MELIAPAAAILGVIVGGVLSASLNAEFNRRREFAEAAVAARAVRTELSLTRDIADASMRDGRWGAILDPGLPYARGLWAVEHREGKRSDSAWVTHGGALARCLTFEEWETVSAPYDVVDRTFVLWTDDPNRELTDDARDHFRALVASIPPALLALEPIARGQRRTRLQRLLRSR
jgi:hypothetical protein